MALKAVHRLVTSYAMVHTRYIHIAIITTLLLLGEANRFYTSTDCWFMMLSSLSLLVTTMT